MKVPFYKYTVELPEHSNVSDVLDGENINQVSMLEEEFATYLDVDQTLAASSGTAALHLAMLALDLKRGDKIVCSVNTHPSVPEVVRHFDAEPVFIDIDAENFHIDIDKLEEYLQANTTKKLKAVVVTLLGGVNIDLDKLYETVTKYNVKIIIDAVEALGSSYKGDKIVKYADITCFDFSPHLKENICSGGMLASDDSEIIQRARLLSNHAIKRMKIL